MTATGAAPATSRIEIEAGLAFGTGHHGTTVGCLEMIETVVRRERPKNALDLGTGSAVLAIALAKLAHIPVLATDIDPVATQVAAAECAAERRLGLVETRTAPASTIRSFAARAPFDLIVANILARPLMRLAPDMARFGQRPAARSSCQAFSSVSATPCSPPMSARASATSARCGARAG